MPPEAPAEEELKLAQADTTETVETKDVEQAAPSAADDKGDKSPASMFDAVKAALNPTPAEASPASEGQDEDEPKSEDGKTDEAKAEGAAEDEEELSEDDLSRLNRKTRKSVRRLLKDRAELRAELDDLRPAAERFHEMRRFTDEAGLVSQEITAGFEIMRLMKHEPEKALEALAPYVQQLMQITGRLLPKDLQEQVRTGQISPEAANELSRNRARVAFTEQRETQRHETQVKQEQTAAQRQAITTMANAVTALEQTWRTSDPDYAVKSARVQEKVQLAIHNGQVPQTPDDAVALVKKCKAEVDTELKRFQPKRQQMTPVTGGSSPSAAPKPSSTLDAIRRVVAA
jgi:hypothetical protein